mgnify:FL=1
MGAQLWHHAAPWHPDPGDSLFDLQVQFLEKTYDLPSLVAECLESSREAVRLIETEGDEYGLLDMYRDRFALLEEIASRPLPENPQERIELVRTLYGDSGEGIGNILDVRAVSDRRDYPTTERLVHEETSRLVGGIRPTLAQARQAVDKINEELHRGESVCFPFYDESDDEQPAGWYFVGNTID